MHIDRIYTLDTLDQMLQAGDADYQARQQEAMRLAEAQVQIPAEPMRLMPFDDRYSIWFADGSYYIGIRVEPDTKPDFADVTFLRKWHVGEKKMELVQFDHPHAARDYLWAKLLVAELKRGEA